MQSHHYNTLHDDDLWDQLNDEQSREVQQHQSRFHETRGQSRTQPWVVFQSMTLQTMQRLAIATQSAWMAAREAWSRHPSRPSPEMDLDFQFGLQDLTPTANSATAASTTAVGATPNSALAPEPQPNPGYPFVVLQQVPSRRAIQRAQDHWGIVANMDVFLTHLYQYYYHRGVLPMFLKFLVEFISLLFTLWLSRHLLLLIDWRQLLTCQDEESCHAHWSQYYRTTSLPTWYWWLIQGYTILFLAYAVFSVWNFWHTLQHTWRCQYILHEKLGISQRKLQGGAVAWDHVVEQLLQAQDSGDYRTALSSLDPLKISQRIMRRENFLIAFWNQGILNVQIANRHYWCPSLEWCVHSCILNFMFNHKYEIRPAFCLDSAALERRLQVCGLVHALLLPFLILFVILHFFFRNVYDFKTTRQYMGDKQWSTVAQWTFREFNELPHVLERRLEPSYEASENYLKLFGQSEWVAALGKLLVFLGGAVGGLLLVLGVLNDAILLHVQLWGRNLLWYAGIAGIIYSIGKALLPTKEAQPSVTRNLFADMDSALKQVATHTHYYPEHWKGRGWDTKVHGQFGNMFDSKVKLFLWELVSLIVAPYILIFKLPKCAPAICEFVLTIKAKVPGAGDVCGYSTFDFDRYKDETWEGKTLGTSNPPLPEESLTQSILRTGNLEEATRNYPKPKAREGKMEKSFFSFQTAHPSWKCSPSGQSLVDRVEEYKKAELSAMTRERELYVEAAARQLETLAKLEQAPSLATPFQHLNASHIPRVPDADEGAGTHSPQLNQTLRLPPTIPPRPESQVASTGQTTFPPSIPALQLLTPRVESSGDGALPFAGDPSHISPNTTNSQLSLSHLSQSNRGPIPDMPSSLNPAIPAQSTSDSTMRAGLSTELRRLLTMSTLDAAHDSLLQDAATFPPHRPPASESHKAERQYFWLERFHEHLENQQQQGQSAAGSNHDEPAISRSLPTHQYRPPPAASHDSNDRDPSASSMV